MTHPPRRRPGRPGTDRTTQALPPSRAATGGGSGGALALLCGWTVFLVAALAFLHAIGGALAPPPVGDPGRLGDWVARRQPAEAAVAVVRLLAIAVAWYLLAVTVAGTIARLAGIAPLIRAADAISLPAVQRLVSGAMGVSMVAAMLVGAGAAAGAGERIGSAADPAGETMRRLPDAGVANGPGNATAPPGGGEGDPASPPTMRRLPAAPAGGGGGSGDPSEPATESQPGTAGATTAPTMRRLPAAPAGPAAQLVGGEAVQPPGASPGGSSTSPASRTPASTTSRPPTPPVEAGSTTTRPAAASSTAPAEAASPSGAPGPGPLSPATRTGAGAGAPADPRNEGVEAAGTRTWRVQPGDHFWSVAERVLAEAWHRAPTDAEVDPYWRALVEANAAILRDPANPDLLFPDQVIALPLPPAGRTPE